MQERGKISGGDAATVTWRVDPYTPNFQVLEQAGALVREGRLVAFPTETVYGLAANASDVAAVTALFSTKGRPEEKPLILHLAAPEELIPFVSEVPPLAEKLIEVFWPGPLTLVFKSAGKLPSMVTGGRPTIAARVPAHPVALGLIRAAGVPVVAPSANLSGRASPVTAAEVLADLAGRIDAVIDGGRAPLGVESTVLDVTGEVPQVLRLGAVSAEDIAAVTGIMPVVKGDKKRTPFRPGVPLVVVEGGPAAVKVEIDRRYKDLGPTKKIGIIAREENAATYPGMVIPCGRGRDTASFAACFYLAVAELAAVCDLILVECPPDRVGLRERLRRMAAEVIRAGD